MISDAYKTLFTLIIALLIVLWWFTFNAEYEAVRRYYPGLTKWEYFFLGDKIRITPDD